MTEEKHTRMEKAAVEAYCIAKDYYPILQVIPARWSDYARNRVLIIAKSIKKHCPEDKGVEKLVEAATNLCDDFGDNLQDWDAHRSVLVDELRIALADYEGKQSEDDNYENFVRNQEK